MKLISWNVNGLRACMEKGFSSFLEAESPDLIALQETKMQPGQAEIRTPGYEQYWNSAEKKGYSGTAVFSRLAPLSVRYGLGLPKFDTEGRVITLEFDPFYFVTSYSPNSQDGLKRIDYRMEYEDALRAHLTDLDRSKPVILCGDLNVAHQEIDLKNPDQNRENAGFSLQEREKMTRLLASGFSDSFRVLYPDAVGRYSWWSYRFSARQRNAGWRIDYFIVSERLMPAVKDSLILDSVTGSDHCPVGLVLEV
ncbi:MAG: exodeoxyribonuclease III [Clostridia bacterium]|nr:exodeoxyribonuclease III [Clostridia bacterium]